MTKSDVRPLSQTANLRLLLNRQEVAARPGRRYENLSPRNASAAPSWDNKIGGIVAKLESRPTVNMAHKTAG